MPIPGSSGASAPLGPLTAPQAYREDLRLNPGREMLSPHDNEWIVVAHAMQRLAGVLPSERQEYARRLAPHLVASAEGDAADGGAPSEGQVALERLGAALHGVGDSKAADMVFEACLGVTDQMDQAGAYFLSFSTLGYLRTALPDASPRYHGWSLANQARIARQLGDLDTAADLCDTAEQLGNLTQDQEIMARAACVRGGLSLMRGNHPQAREAYEFALRSAERARSVELEGVAHRGLLIVHATAGEFDLAITHGWHAFERAKGDAASRAELLANLAAVCSDCGYYQAAFAAFTLSALWTAASRVRVPALGGAALAAAHLGNTIRLRALTQRIESDLAAGATPYDAAHVLLDLARAHAITRDGAAVGLASRAKAIAAKHSFHEIEYAAAEIMAAVPAQVAERRAPIELSDSSSQVLSSITALADDTSAFESLAGATRE
jgi:tetratricopeptide (TPR) repeat protein